MWLRHAPAPLLWIHPVAKNRVLMPDGDSNAIFYSSGIFIVGTCPPMKMVGKFAFSAVCVPPLWGGTFFYSTGKYCSGSPSTGSTRREQYRLVSISRPV